MEKRKLGRTDHMSTIAVFGGAAFWEIDQAEADATMEKVIATGINHIDVAPSYGIAEERLGPWLERERSRFFLGCKTMERTREGAAAEMRRSLVRLRVKSFDLYQLHAITNQDELDQATGRGGALEAARDAQQAGLTRYIGITGHGLRAPALFLEALRRFDFDTVLFPINANLYSNPDYRRDSQELLQVCRDRNVGTMIIKSVAKGMWGDHQKKYTTWYEPYDDPAHIQEGVNFVLSQDVSVLCTPGDTTILPMVLDACEHFAPMSAEEQQALIVRAREDEPVFV